VFVHNSNVKPMLSTRCSLIKGEYVSLRLSDDGSGRPLAINVTGVCGGPLMCDHRPPRRTPPGKSDGGEAVEDDHDAP
jgi:hypothetical protein